MEPQNLMSVSSLTSHLDHADPSARELCTPASKRRSMRVPRTPTQRSVSPARRSRRCWHGSRQQSLSPSLSPSPLPSPLRRIVSAVRHQTPLLTPLKPAAAVRKQHQEDDSLTTVFERKTLATVFERCADRSRSPRRPAKLHVAATPSADSDSMLDKFMTKVRYGAPPGTWATCSDGPGPYSNMSKSGDVEASKPSRRSSFGGA